MKLRLIIDSIFLYIFIGRKLNYNEVKNTEKIVYLVKNEISNFYVKKIQNIRFKKNYQKELCIANLQFYYKNFINSKYFNQKIATSWYYNKYFYFPLDFETLRVIQSQGIKVNFFISIILLKTIFFLFFLKDFCLIIFLIFCSFKFKNANRVSRNIIYLSYIPILKQSHNSNNKLNFFLWIKKKFKLSKNILFLHQNKKIKDSINLKDDYEICNEKYILNFFFINNLFSLVSSIFNAYKLIKQTRENNIFSSINFYILKDIIFFFYLKNNYQLKPKICLFSNIEIIYRPFWTYSINKNTFLYYMSTNTNFIKKKKSKYIFYDLFFTKLYTWNNYICWTKSQKKWLTDNIIFYKPKISIVKYIPYEGEHIILSKDKNKKTLTIFDVPPKKKEDKRTYLNSYNIYSERYCIKYIKDIFDVLKNNKKYQIILKIKRVNAGISRKYLEYVYNLMGKNNITIYEREISPQSLIRISDIVISIPFSSSSIIAKRMKKISYFYDPDNIIELTNYNPKDVMLIQSKKKLKKIFFN